ncbi:MAG: gliding motility-associated C-terminal domain-containing protein [Bacteroidia bacterium]
MKYFLPLVFCLLIFIGKIGYASHNLAGQITCKWIGANQYEITLTTYTDPAPANVDRFFADIEIWNKQTGSLLYKISNVPRANGPTNAAGQHLGAEIYQTVKKNIYVTSYTFPGQGAYLLRYFDPTRRADIKNIVNPENVNFYVETFFYLTNPLAGNNNSPILLNDPLDEACIGKIWTHNPGGYDLDGDSLHYSLLPSQQYDSQNGPYQPINATGYQYPDNLLYGVSALSIHPITGVMTWVTPQTIGVYNIAYTVEEFRGGVKIGHVLRDMVIIVKVCNNNPPTIVTIQDTCIQAGSKLVFPFKAYEQDSVDSIYLALNNANLGSNGPFAVTNPATIELTNPWGGTLPTGLPYPAEITGNVVWETDCSNIRTSPYQVDFYAHDNFSYFGSSSWKAMLSDHKAVSIFISPPPAYNLTLSKNQGVITLNWLPSDCDNAVGYYIYRKIGGDIWNNDGTCCKYSPEVRGYQLIGYVQGWSNTTYIDNLQGIANIYGNTIDYLVTAMFGNPANPTVESCPTNNANFLIEKDSLFITKAEVLVSNLHVGKIKVEWTKPKNIDAFFKAPYQYKLFRANNNQYPALWVATLTENDTSYIDTLLNTNLRNYNYRIVFCDADGKEIACAGTQISSSIHLKSQGFPDKVLLDWKVSAGWQNEVFELYRKVGNANYTLLAVISANGAENYHLEDSTVLADSQYCYLILSKGKYQSLRTPNPITNYSNETCAYTKFSELPCTPNISVNASCETYLHEVSITRLGGECDAYTSVFTLYYGLNAQGPFVPLQSLYANFGTDTTFTISHANSPAYYSGCYTLTATSKYNTTSELSAAVCVNYCPILEISNVFTPNADGNNDWFAPIKLEAVRLQHIDIYDRWGNNVYSNIAEPERLWDGYLSNRKTPAKDGVYYYVLRYEELNLQGNISRVKKGWVMLMR